MRGQEDIEMGQSRYARLLVHEEEKAKTKTHMSVLFRFSTTRRSCLLNFL